MVKAWLLATLLHAFIVEQAPRSSLTLYFILLVTTVVLRALLVWLREQVGFIYGATIRQSIRQQVLNRLEALGPA